MDYERMREDWLNSLKEPVNKKPLTLFQFEEE